MRKTFIIAEIGVNHNGSLRLAKKLVEAAAAAGADAVKFQTFKAEELATKNAPSASYQRAGSQYEMLKALELSEPQLRELFKYCKRKKVGFLSTPFDLKSAEFLARLGVRAFKVSSGDLTNLPLLRALARYSKPLILSTGMATLAEVKAAVAAIRSAGNQKITLLHCVSSYPARSEEVNLRAMDTLKQAFSLPAGYSDHTLGIEVAIAATARGAEIIEKHLTLDRGLSGPDHRTSAEPDEFRALVRAIRKVESALGDGKKVPQKSEREIMRVARKSIVARENIIKGEKIKGSMLAIKRPGTGIRPRYFNKLIGQVARRNIRQDQILNCGDIIWR